MEPPPGAESAIPQAQAAQVRGVGRPVHCPICGSDHTRLYRTDVDDLEYFVIPPRDFAMQKCGGCGSEFLDPRPFESELPPFYPERLPRLQRKPRWRRPAAGGVQGSVAGALLRPADPQSARSHLRRRDR